MKLKTTKKNKNINAFTLVELIVVVMIIGILSAIAIPIFSSLTENTRHREASTLINSYLSAAKAYYAESGSPSKNAGDLSNYVDVFECLKHMIRWCNGTDKSFPGVRKFRNMGDEYPQSQAWNSPSGYYTIKVDTSNDDRFQIRALPQVQSWDRSQIWSDEGLGVSACFNYQSGVSIMKLWSKKGYLNVKNIDC